MKKAQQKILIGVLVVIIIGAIVLVVIGSNSNITGEAIKSFEGDNQQSCNEVEIPYEDQEEYLKTEYYTETVPYEDRIPLQYGDSLLDERSCGSLTNYKKCFDVAVMNLDTVGGIFAISCNFRTLKRELYDSKSLYVKPGNTETFNCVADVNLGEDVELTYDVTPPTKSVTKYKDMQRERQVTAYRLVTKYKTEIVCE